MNQSNSRWMWIALASIVFFMLCLGIVVGEIYLRRTMIYADFAERTNRFPDLSFQTEGQVEPWLWIRAKNLRWQDKKPEYEQEIRTNAEGLPGELPDWTKQPNEVRILVIGDSFTEGAGDIEMAGGYPSILSRDLRKTKARKQYTVVNAGVSGSDPIFGIELLRRRLLKYSPDIVLLTINETDISDLERRGGFDRFDEKGFLKPRRTPGWTWLFERSHLFRAFILGWLHFDWELRSPSESVQARQVAIEQLVESGRVARQLANEKGFKFLPIIHPQWVQVQQRSLGPELQQVERGLKEAGVDYADLLDDFLAEIPGPITKDYYWELDFHFTHKGYEVFAHAVEKALKKRNWL